MYTAESYRFAASAEEAFLLLREDPSSAVIGGGLWLRSGRGRYSTLIDVSRAGLDGIGRRDGAVTIGAGVTLRQIETSPLLREAGMGVLSECVRPIVGVPFRNMATVGGSVCARLGFSDLLTAMLALDARVTLFEAGEMPLEEYLGKPPKKDLLLSVTLPEDGRASAYETLRLTATDIGMLDLCAAALPDGSWRVSVGARPGAAVRCREAEAALGRGDADGASGAVRALAYGSTHRASAEYRREMSAVLLGRAAARIRGNTV